MITPSVLYFGKRRATDACTLGHQRGGNAPPTSAVADILTQLAQGFLHGEGEVLWVVHGLRSLKCAEIDLLIKLQWQVTVFIPVS